MPGELQLGKGKAGEGQSILQRVNGTERRETRQLWNRPEDNLVAKVGCSSPTHWDSSPLGAATGRVLLSGSKSSPWEDLKGALWKGEKRGGRTARGPEPAPHGAFPPRLLPPPPRSAARGMRDQQRASERRAAPGTPGTGLGAGQRLQRCRRGRGRELAAGAAPRCPALGTCGGCDARPE